MLKIERKLQICLIGTPNVGKTSLFNYLTGENNLIGNWDGVTTDITSSSFNYLENLIHIKDLPGCYSLITSLQMSLDEKLVCKYLINENLINEQILVNIISLENLARDLYLTLQLLEQNHKIIILLNISNYSEIHNLSQEHNKLIIHLENALNCKIIPCNIATGYNLETFKESILVEFNANSKKNNLLPKYISKDIMQKLQYLLRKYKFKHLGELIKYLEGDILIKELYKHLNLSITESFSWDILFANSRHEFINNYLLVNYTQFYKDNFYGWTERLDKIFLHKYFGLPIFISILYIIFLYISKLGSFFQQYFNQKLIDFLINPIAKLLNSMYFPELLLKIFNDGIVIGLETLWNFIPILFFMNMGLLFLENCGYMVRVVFLLDKLMGYLGLSGRSIIPMIVGFSCNVPAINGAKVLSNKRDKIITILMTPFMSCNARLVTYSVFATAFFNNYEINIIFYLYIIGIIFGIFTGFLLNKILDGNRDNLLMELPKYKIPSIKFIINASYYKVKRFINNTGCMIILICSLISVIKLLDFNFLHTKLFKFIMLIFKPMGINIDNWPAVASLFTGLIAKETIIGSLYSFYYTNEQEIFGVLCNRFGDYKSAFAYLLFILLSFPCVSVITSIIKELGKYWAIFTVVWTTWLAYLVSICYYQLATFSKHPLYSTGLLLLMFSLFIILLFSIKFRMIFLNLEQKLKKTTLIPLIINNK